MKKLILLFVIIPINSYSGNMPVKGTLAKLVESAVIETNLNINISQQSKT